MDKRKLALVCTAAMAFWLCALAFGGVQGLASAETAAAENQAALAALTDAGPLWDPAEPAMMETEFAAQTDPAPAPAAAVLDGEAAAETAGVAAVGDTLELPCRAAILVDQASGTVLYEKDADQQMPIASITKVMTLLLTFEAVHAGKIDYNDTVPISEHAFGMGGSQIWLEPGEIFTLDEMLKAICVSSANDAAVAVAEFVGGSEPSFVSQMNAKAAELGMTNTNFCNACGLDEAGHLSTARDVAAMSRQILNECPEVLNYTGIWMDSLRDGQTQLINTNKLLKHYSGITGLKTGTTGGAGVCISASATRDGLSLIAVVLGAPSSQDRFAAATTLLDYGFANYEAAAVPQVPNAPLELDVRGGAEETVSLDYSAVPGSMLLQKGQGKALTADLELPERLEAPVAGGDPVGTVRVYSGETLLGEYPVAAARSVEKLDLDGALRLLLGHYAAG